MILTFLLSGLDRFARSRTRFVWSPALDLRDRTVFSTLLPGVQY